MKEILLCKCGELVLKGLNRRKFEDRLQKTLYWRLKKVGNFKIHGCQSTFYVEPLDENASMDEAWKSAAGCSAWWASAAPWCAKRTFATSRKRPLCT